MTTHTNPLDNVKVAAPCPADWERMVGDERVRYCDQCRLKVYNLSGMNQREAETLLATSEGRLCVRFYRRADGTILTENCPTGLRAIKQRVRRVASATLSAVLGLLAGIGLDFSYGALGGRIAPDRGRTMGVMVREPPPSPKRVELVAPAPGEWTKGEATIPAQSQEHVGWRVGRVRPTVAPETQVLVRPQKRNRTHR